MSKRFGRNQKRALKQQVRELQSALDRANDRIQFTGRNLEIAESHLRETARMLGKYFASLPPKVIPVDEVRDLMTWENPPLPWAQATPSSTLPPEYRAVQRGIIRLTRLDRAYLDDLSGNIHMRFTTPAGEVAYGVSDKAFRNVSDEYLAQHLVPEISREIVGHLAEIRGRGFERDF